MTDNKPLADRREVIDQTPKHLVWLTSILVCGMVTCLFLWPVPKSNENVLYLVVGQVIGGWLMALNYYFGTTSHSRDKDKLLANSVPIDKRGSYEQAGR